MSAVHHSLPSAITARTVGALAAPIVVSNLSYTLMAICDVLFVSRLGTEPLAAIGLAVVVMYLVRAFGFGLLSGVRIATAQAVGAGDDVRAARTGWQAVWLSLLMGVAVLPGIALGLPYFRLNGASEAVAHLAAVYLGIRLGGAMLSFLLYGLTVAFQARGNTRTPMVANVLSNVVNVVLTPVLVFGLGPAPELGIAGAAIATVFGTALGVAWLAPRWLRSTGHVHGLDRAALGRIWGFGWPIGLANTMEIGSIAVVAAILVRCGDAHLAAHLVVIRILSVSFLPGLGIAEATGVLSGQAVGAGRPELVRQAIWSGLKLAMVVMSLCGVLFFLFPLALLMPFGLEDDVLGIARNLLVIAAAFQVFDAVLMVLFHALSGAGDTRFVTLANTGSAWIVQLPLAWGLAIGLDLGAPGAWYALTAQILVVAVVLTWRARTGRWLAQHAAEAAPVTSL